jgi:putative restriction endonuclease
VDLDQEREFREAAMGWLDGRREQGHERFPYAELADYEYKGARIPLIDRQRGIRKPAIFHAALSIRTTYTPPGKAKPYDDRIPSDGLLRYKYRGDNPKHHENRALRTAFDLGLPLMWFVGVASGIYEARYPVWIREDQPEKLEFILELPHGAP